MIAQRREKLVQQIAMRGMHLDDTKATFERAPGCRRKSFDHLVDALRIECLGLRVVFGIGEG